MADYSKRIENILVSGCVIMITLCMYFTFVHSNNPPKWVGLMALIFGISLMAWPWIAYHIKKEQ